MNTTSPVMTVTDDLIEQLEALTCFDESGVVLIHTDQIRYLLTELRRLRAENAELARDAGRYRAWESIIDEVERRAGKECCIEHGCDFTVTVMHDDYVNALAAK